MNKEIKMVCKNNPKHDVVDKEKSNANWKVYLSKCPICGGEVVFQ